MKVTNVVGALCFALVLGACNNVDFKKTKGGMPYKLYPSKSGTAIKAGDFVKVQITQKIKDSLLFSSYKTMPQYFPVTAEGYPYHFSEVLTSMKEGDSLYAVQLIDTFMARDPRSVPPTFKKGDKVETTVKVLKVFTSQDEVQKDQQIESASAFARDTMVQTQLKKDVAGINNYLAANKITAQQTGKGTFVQILNPGTGPQVAEGKYVSVKYTGSTFEGKVFDSNTDPSKGHTEPLVFQVGAPGMIMGFDEGIRTLHEGGKARLFVPSTLAYGAQSPSPDIKPFENLIFDIEVLKVSDQPLQQQMPQGAQPTNIDSAQHRK